MIVAVTELLTWVTGNRRLNHQHYLVSRLTLVTFRAEPMQQWLNGTATE